MLVDQLQLNTDGSGEAEHAKTTSGVSGTSGNADVYPIIIIAQDFGGCATLGGMDSLRSKVVLPKALFGNEYRPR